MLTWPKKVGISRLWYLYWAHMVSGTRDSVQRFRELATFRLVGGPQRFKLPGRVTWVTRGTSVFGVLAGQIAAGLLFWLV